MHVVVQEPVTVVHGTTVAGQSTEQALAVLGSSQSQLSPSQPLLEVLQAVAGQNPRAQLNTQRVSKEGSIPDPKILTIGGGPITGPIDEQLQGGGQKPNAQVNTQRGAKRLEPVPAVQLDVPDVELQPLAGQNPRLQANSQRLS